jgi:hypothetical protein
MPFNVIQPPAEEQKLAEVGRELFEAAKKLGIKLDLQGFIFAWANGTRVLVERSPAGEIVSLALMTVGHRWTHDDFTATLLHFEGNTAGLLEFAKTIANALGAKTLFYEKDKPSTGAEGELLHTIIETRLQ